VSRAVLRFKVRDAAFALWSQNGRYNFQGNLFCADIWACHVFNSQYILSIIIRQYMLVCQKENINLKRGNIFII